MTINKMFINAKRQVAAILVAKLVIVHWTKNIFETGQELEKSIQSCEIMTKLDDKSPQVHTDR